MGLSLMVLDSRPLSTRTLWNRRMSARVMAGEELVLEEGVEVLPKSAFPVPPGGFLENLGLQPVGEKPVKG